MKKYKLIKWYPSLPRGINEGSIISTKNGVYPLFCDKGSLLGTIYKDEVEKYPEFWAEIIEKDKDYEILSFKNSENIVYLCGNQHESCINYQLQSSKIHSVKRLSDGEVFTVGDNVSYNYGKGYCYNSEMNKWKPAVAVSNNTIIENIEIIDNKITIKTSYNRFYYTIDSYSNNKKPLFKTEDGVDIYEGDKYYYVDKESFDIHCATKAKVEFDEKMEDYLDFSTEVAAEYYVMMNEPKFSINDIMEGLFKYEGKSVKTDYNNKLKKLYSKKKELLK